MTRSHEDEASAEEGEGEAARRDAKAETAEMSPALRAMVEELRAEAPPELPWDAMERRLLDRIAQGEDGEVRPERSGSAIRQIAGLAAAAALLALFVSSGGGEGALEPSPRAADARVVNLAPGPAGDRDLAALRPGDAVEAGDQPIAFARPGDVRFTLAARSRAMITASSAAPARTVIELERGAIRAEVDPRDPAEGIVDAFVVEAGRTRVAVRGTAFSVERAEDSILVDVEHGTVAVGRAGRPGVLLATSLVGPARASFSLDGVHLATLPPGGRALFDASDRSAPAAPSEPLAIAKAAPPAPLTPLTPLTPIDARPEAPPRSPAPPPTEVSPPSTAPAPSEAPAPEAPAPEPPAPSPSPAAPPPPAPPAPSAAPQAEPPPLLTPASIKAGVERCFNQIYRSRQTQVKLSVASTMRIQVRADGTIQSAAFSPPLAPSFQICAGSAIAGRFKSGPQTITIPVSFGP